MADDQPSSPTRILLVRHGESNVTVQRIVGGALTCTGLSPLGRQQAERLRDRFAEGHERSIDVLYSSTMPRARETAEIIAPALGGLEVHEEHDLEEARPGEADGIPFADFAAKYGDPPGDDDPYRPMAPGAESRGEFFHRVGVAVSDVVRHHSGQTVLIACHGGVIDMAMRMFLGQGLRLGHDLWTLNTSITEFVRPETDTKPGRWRLVRYNDAAHTLGLPHETPRDH